MENQEVTTETEETEVITCCECETELDDDAIDHDGDHYCQDCFNERFSYCEACGEVIDNDDIMEHDGCFYCSDCFNDLFCTCEHCSEPIRIQDSCHVDGSYYCEDCYTEHYTACQECGCIIHRDYTYYHEGNEADYCERCYNRIIAEESSAIHKYSFKPDPVFFSNDGNKKLFLGIELEVESQERRDIAEDLQSHDELYCKEDSSLDNGVEIVSHPCTIEYHRENMKWEEILKLCKDKHGKSHNTSTCGLHIHINRKYLSGSEQIKLGMFVNMQKDKMEIIARRTYNTYAKFKEKSLKEYGLSSERYECVNFENRKTIEFRLYKGTLKYETFIATLELTHAITEFVKTISFPQIVNVTQAWELFLKFIIANKKNYSFGYDYLVSKNLLNVEVK